MLRRPTSRGIGGRLVSLGGHATSLLISTHDALISDLARGIGGKLASLVGFKTSLLITTHYGFINDLV